MKFVSSSVEFDFKHDGKTTVHLSDIPIAVDDEVADHLINVFGGRITLHNAPVEQPQAEQIQEELLANEEEEPTVDENLISNESQPKKRGRKPKTQDNA